MFANTLAWKVIRMYGGASCVPCWEIEEILLAAQPRKTMLHEEMIESYKVVCDEVQEK